MKLPLSDFEEILEKGVKQIGGSVLCEKLSAGAVVR